MSTFPISHVKAHLAAMIAAAGESGEAIVITQNGHEAAVLQDIASYEAMRKSLAMLKLVAQGERDLSQGKSNSQAEVFRKLRKKLTAK